MNPWLDGLSALYDHMWAACTILLFVLWGFLIVRGVLYRLLDDALTEIELLTLSAVGWVLPVVLLSSITFLISLSFDASLGGWFAISIICISGFLLIRKKIETKPTILFLFLVTVSIILRFAFLKNLMLPLYFDSAEHYRLIKLIVHSYKIGDLVMGLKRGFYHLGFHYMVAAVSHYFHMNIAKIMLAFGQFVLALLPFPLFFFVKRETVSIPPAFLACLLAGFGFHMPTHLMNWGKYPAQLSLAVMLFSFSLVYMIYRNDLFKRQNTIFIFLIISVLVSALIHSRTLVIYALMFVSIIFTAGWKRLRKPYKISGFIILLLFFAFGVYLIYDTSFLGALLDGYLKSNFWILVFVFVLAVLSAVYYPDLTFFIFLWLVLSIFSLFIPINLPLYGTQTVLDRPFVQMFSYVPLSILGGLGVSGLEKMIKHVCPNSVFFRFSSIALVFGFVFINIILNYDFYPSNCCSFVTRDDLAAFTWIKNNLSRNDNVLVASTNLNVTSFEIADSQAGVDAGVWINPLLSQRIALAWQGISFDLVDTHLTLCSSGVDYIYVGGTPQSFNFLQLENRPAWYVSLFELPSAKIYQVIGC